MTRGKGIDNETTFLTCLDKSLPMKPNLEDFWKLESIGISDSPVESDNDVALKKFGETEVWWRKVYRNMAMEGGTTRPTR